jgi:hypothetical protein
MDWFLAILCGLVCAAFGGAYGGYMASRAVAWLRISSFEGKSGFFIAGMVLLGGIGGLLIGIAGGRAWGGPGLDGAARGFGYSLAAAAAAITLLGALAWASKRP